MQVCSYTLDCAQFDLDFAPKKRTLLHQLHDNNQTLIGYFAIPDSKKFYLKLSYTQEKCDRDIKEIRNKLWIVFAIATLFLLLMSLFFTFYSLRPIRKALQLNDEFIKDILHDFNTPITSMVLNIKMFEEEEKKNPFISRIQTSIDTILLLQNNLKCFLQHSPSQMADVDIVSLLKSRIHIMQAAYGKIHFELDTKEHFTAASNQEMLIRIFDNILSNAAKYNKPKGSVFVSIGDKTVTIRDTGKGIKNISKATQRYYKEQDRGLGLGLHIVQKLTQELNIEMHIESEVGVGTTFILDFK